MRPSLEKVEGGGQGYLLGPYDMVWWLLCYRQLNLVPPLILA